MLLPRLFLAGTILLGCGQSAYEAHPKAPSIYHDAGSQPDEGVVTDLLTKPQDASLPNLLSDATFSRSDLGKDISVRGDGKSGPDAGVYPADAHTTDAAGTASLDGGSSSYDARMWDSGPDPTPPEPLDLPCALPDIPLALPAGDDSARMFAASTLPIFEVTVSDEAWAAFCENAIGAAASESVALIYARARLRISGVDLPDEVGFKARGRSTLSATYGGLSLEECLSRDYSRKPSFKISTNEFVPGTEFRNLRKFNLVGHEGGETIGLKEYFYAALAGELGLPAQRVNHALLCMNGIYMGIYSLQEETDVQHFLDQHFVDPSGNYYKIDTGQGGMHYPYGYTEFYSSRYKPVAGTPDDMAALMDFLAFVNRASDDSTFAAEVESLVNVSLWLKVVALDMALFDWDGAYPRRANYTLYQDPIGGWSIARFDTDGIVNNDPDDWNDIEDGSRVLCYHNGGSANNADGTLSHISSTSPYTTVSNPRHPILPARLLYLYRGDYLTHVTTVASLASSRLDALLDERVGFMRPWIGPADASAGAIVDPYERPYGSEAHELRVESLKDRIREQLDFVEDELSRDLSDYSCP